MTVSGAHAYADDFFHYINAGSLRSARRVTPLVVDWLQPKSLLDVGCGAGAWCRIWSETGVTEVVGVDGEYVDREQLLFPREAFQSRDLSQSFDLGRRFDLVCSLEVAEHVPASSAPTFVDNLVRHGDVVLFSAAVPGQGGEFHVNEQPLDYWRRLFAARNYRCFDPLRPLIVGETDVEPWYRYNALVYVHDARCDGLPRHFLDSEVREGFPVAERAPATWRLRNAVLRRTPEPVRDRLVKLKHAWVRRRNREHGTVRPS